jgi:OmcA/MtrC family decaheme c-type cytochrome
VKLCITCHTSQIIDPSTGETVDHIDADTGNNIDLKIMAHKIHYGAELPSVEDGTPYQIIGFRDSVHDYSMSEFPQDIRNCTKCHTDAAAQGDNYKNNPTRAACGSCHDNVDFSTGENHPAVQLTDNNCSGCHVPNSGTEFDISVDGAHTVLLRSRDLPGMNYEIVSVTSSETGSNRVRPGEHVEIVYSIKTDSGAVIDPMDMDFLEITIAGPTLDYDIQDYNGDGVLTPGEENVLREFPANGSTGPDASGNFTYTFNGMIPNDASGTYAIGIAGRIERTVGGEGLILREVVEESGRNVVAYFPVTDTVAQMRRLVVDNSVEDDLCSSCHGEFSKDFSIHGNIRNNTEYCVLCHNPSNDDINRRPVDGGSAVTTSIDFRQMIHKIHTGEELTNKPYIIFGFGGSLHDFSNIVFPGQTNDCESCHIRNTNILDPGNGILGQGIVSTLNRLFSKQGDNNVVQNTFSLEPVINVCTSCHDNLIVTATGSSITEENHIGGAQPESACVDCHIAGAPLGAQEAHLVPLSPELRINRPQ